jgi:cob(I)alamin adenosyltransferase
VVRLTRIYTRLGDGGDTHLGDMSRVRKTSARVVAYGDVDELNAAIGVARAHGVPAGTEERLALIQNDLFDLGADLCTPVVPNPEYPPLRVTAGYVERLEGWCDEFNAELAKLNSFILPGGTAGAALLHQARTIARRAERSAWALYEDDAEHTNRDAMLYLNRLSDLLFILSRSANPDGDVMWVPGGDR